MSVEEFIAFCGGLGVDAVDLGYYWRDVEQELPRARDWLGAAGAKDEHTLKVNDIPSSDLFLNRNSCIS